MEASPETSSATLNATISPRPLVSKVDFQAGGADMRVVEKPSEGLGIVGAFGDS
jgi:hypothetical protein